MVLKPLFYDLWVRESWSSICFVESKMDATTPNMITWFIEKLLKSLLLVKINTKSRRYCFNKVDPTANWIRIRMKNVSPVLWKVCELILIGTKSRRRLKFLYGVAGGRNKVYQRTLTNWKRRKNNKKRFCCSLLEMKCGNRMHRI